MGMVGREATLLYTLYYPPWYTRLYTTIYTWVHHASSTLAGVPSTAPLLMVCTATLLWAQDGNNAWVRAKRERTMRRVVTQRGRGLRRVTRSLPRLTDRRLDSTRVIPLV